MTENEVMLDMFGVEIKRGDMVVIIAENISGSRSKRLLKATFTGKFARSQTGIFEGVGNGRLYNKMAPSVVVPSGS